MRPYKTAFPPEFLAEYQKGHLAYAYRGIRCLKSPIDIAIYLRAIWDLKPKTIIEIGTHSGGSAMLLNDIARIYDLGSRVYSIDLDPPAPLRATNVTFLKGDVSDLATVFSANGLDEAPHPWFVTEDSAHSYQGCRAALNFLSEKMATDDLLVMEDGVLDELGLTERYDGGPNRAIVEFMAEKPGIFEVRADLCDMFGPNATYAPNGYLKKI